MVNECQAELLTMRHLYLHFPSLESMYDPVGVIWLGTAWTRSSPRDSPTQFPTPGIFSACPFHFYQHSLPCHSLVLFSLPLPLPRSSATLPCCFSPIFILLCGMKPPSSLPHPACEHLLPGTSGESIADPWGQICPTAARPGKEEPLWGSLHQMNDQKRGEN